MSVRFIGMIYLGGEDKNMVGPVMTWTNPTNMVKGL